MNEVLHQALINIKINGPGCDKYGICFNLDTVSNHGWAKLVASWEHYSGIPAYPIPPKPLNKWQRFRVKYLGHQISDAHTVYRKTQNNGGKWDTSTEYGRLRWMLIDYLIEKTKDEQH